MTNDEIIESIKAITTPSPECRKLRDKVIDALEKKFEAENLRGEKYESGFLIGEAIGNLFKAIAKLDGITPQKAMDSWIERYVAERIIDATGESS